MSKWYELDEHSMWHQVDTYFCSTQKQEIYNLRAWCLGFMNLRLTMRQNIDQMAVKEFLDIKNEDGSVMTFDDCHLKLIVDNINSLVVNCLHNHNTQQAVEDVKYILSELMGIQFDRFFGDLTAKRFMCYVALQELRWDYLPRQGGYFER